ncbi:MAG: L-2-hydroxyglutarate oxidase [Nitrospirota bacterium]
MKSYDTVIIGAGIVGLMTARQLLARKESRRVLILEKEDRPGRHASGRNSGVLHTGVYYPGDSLKAKFCAEGNRGLKAYALEHKIACANLGKVIVAQSPQHVDSLMTLYERGKANGIRIERIDAVRLKELEPYARTCETALHLPDAASIDAHAVLRSVAGEVADRGGEIRYGEGVHTINDKEGWLMTVGGRYGYGRLINAAGLHADRLAHQCGTGLDYVILPFKGLYGALKPEKASLINGHIYPTPDLTMPFLGVHLSRTIDGTVLVGPTAIPALGRENYGLFSGLSLRDTPEIFGRLLAMYYRGENNFRSLVAAELAKYSSRRFLAEVKKLCPSVEPRDLVAGAKVGIRAQLLNRRTRRLVMDFTLTQGERSIHVLNAISPAFTCSIPLAAHIATAITHSGTPEQTPLVRAS